MIELTQCLRLAEDGVDATVEVVVCQGLEDDRRLEETMLTQEGHTEAAGPENASRAILVGGEWCKTRAIQADCIEQLGQGGLPVARLERRPVGVEVCLRLPLRL